MPATIPYFPSEVEADLAAVRRSWLWLVAGGIIQLIVGGTALLFPVAATIVSVQLFGILLICAAVAQLLAVVRAQGWGGSLFAILAGMIYLFAGVVLLEKPMLAAEGYTLLLTMLFFCIGVLRIFAAIAVRYSGWGWALFSGAVSVVLAMLMWQGFPDTALWVVGTFIGIDLTFSAISWIVLGIAAKQIPPSETPGTQPVEPPAGSA